MPGLCVRIAGVLAIKTIVVSGRDGRSPRGVDEAFDFLQKDPDAEDAGGLEIVLP